MMRSILFIVLIFVPVASLAATAKQIIVPVSLTYQGVTITARLAVDTGASVTTIDSRLADRLGIPRYCRPDGLAQMADGRAIAYRTAVMDVAAATMIRNGLGVNIMDYTANREADGMLGLDFLSGMTMTLDWRHKRIYWSE